MNKRLLSVIKYLLILSIGAILLFLAFRGVSLKDTIHEMMQANLFWVLVSVLTSLVAFFSRAIRWNMLIEPLGFKPALINTSSSLMVGYLANLAVPRMGEVSRCGMLNRSEKIPFDSLLGTVIIERIIDVICLLLCILFVALTEYARLGNFLTHNIFNPTAKKLDAILNSPLLLTFLATAVVLLIVILVRRKNNTNTLLLKFHALVKGIVNGINTIRKLKSPLAFLFHTVLIWFMYFLMSYTCFWSLEATASLDWHAGMFILVVGGMGMSAPVQGGIGAYHLLVSQGLLLYGVAIDHGLTFATLMHTSQTLVVIILGTISFFYLSLKRRNAKSNGPTQH
jgi:uncharacterized protein (TIRG00374 family)